MKKVLIVVDVQNDFSEDGSLACIGLTAIVPGINQIMESGWFDLIVGTQDWHPEEHISFGTWPRHCVQNTSGAEFHKELKSELFNIIIRKGMSPKVDSYSALFDNDKQTPTYLHHILNNSDTITLCGVATDVCVKATYEDLLRMNFKNVNVLSNLCVGTTVENHVAAIGTFEQQEASHD
jgi:nicotinamidase/pyrazinamidase